MSELAEVMSLEGRVAIVTGGASGIGIGIAAMLAEAGATVVIVDRDEAGAEREAASLQAAGHRAEAIGLDLADEASIVRGCAAITARHPTPWLLVNNAGLQTREKLLEATAAHWDRMFAVNARGAFLITREIARVMVAAGKGGRIVNIASNSARAPAIMGLAAYAASKGALLTFSQTAAFELVAHNITVNTVLPGGVITPGSSAGGPATGPAASRRPPLGMCEPRDIGVAVLFFATPAARYITNQSIEVDAGYSLT
jgi:NAD(P)-dependent dehydrogenase (short-subunit alcohol dehydrogenase family)